MMYDDIADNAKNPLPGVIRCVIHKFRILPDHPATYDTADFNRFRDTPIEYS